MIETLISIRVKLVTELAVIVEIWDIGLMRQLAMNCLGTRTLHRLLLAQVFVFLFFNSIIFTHAFMKKTKLDSQ